MENTLKSPGFVPLVLLLLSILPVLKVGIGTVDAQSCSSSEQYKDIRPNSDHITLWLKAEVCGTHKPTHKMTLRITANPGTEWAADVLFLTSRYNFTGASGGTTVYMDMVLLSGDASFVNVTETFNNNVDYAASTTSWEFNDNLYHKDYVLTATVSIPPPALPPAGLDIAVTSIAPSRSFTYNCGLSCSNYTFNPIRFDVTVVNQRASSSKSFQVTLTANSTNVDFFTPKNVVDLSPGASVIIPFNWTASSNPVGSYLLTAQASSLYGETNTTNNVYTYSGFHVYKAGDVDWDSDVDLDDLTLVYLHQNTSDTRYDINYDGRVDGTDLDITHRNQFT